MKRIPVLLLLALGGLRAEDAPPAQPEDLLPEDALLCLKVESVADLRKALAASGAYSGALDGTWEALATGLLAKAGVDPKPRRTVLWDLLTALEPHLEGPAAAALLKEGPVVLLKAKSGEALKMARKRGLCAEMDGEFLKLSRRRIPSPARPLSRAALYRKARGAAGGPLFLYADPGALAHAGLLGTRIAGAFGAEGRAPFAETLAWSSTFGKDGISDTLRLVRPGRKGLLPAPAPGRLASACPPQAAVTLSGRISLERIRELLACLTGRDWIAREPLLEEASGWEGEFAASLGWVFVLPDILLGFEAKDPPAVVRRILREAVARGATVQDGLVSLPGQTLPWTVRAGDRAVWIGTMPGSVTAAAKAPPPGKGEPAGLRGVLKLPEAFGPAVALLGNLQKPGGPPIGKLLSAKARCTLSVDEDADGLVLRSKSPCGLLPALLSAGLGLQALHAHAVVEPPLSVTAPVQASLPRVRGLEFLKPLEIQVVTAAETHALFAREFDKELPPEKLARMEETMRAFGLLEPGQDLKAILNGAFVDLVGGFYDPEAKKLFLIQGMPMQRIIAAHEMTHALQDQHFGIGEMQKALGKGPADADREAALLALIEGDASVAMFEAFQAVSGRDPAGAIRMLLEILSDPGLVLGQLDAMQEIPDALLEQTMFSYDEGADFVRAVRDRTGWKGVDAMFRDPPVSTEQILHPEKYHKTPRDLPKRVEAPKAPEGWAPVDEDTMGELGIRSYLRHWLGSGESDRAAAGWGADRFALLARGKERLLLWRTAWDSERDAEEFAGALRKAQERRYGKDGGRTRIEVEGAEVEFRDGPSG